MQFAPSVFVYDLLEYHRTRELTEEAIDYFDLHYGEKYQLTQCIKVLSRYQGDFDIIHTYEEMVRPLELCHCCQFNYGRQFRYTSCEPAHITLHRQSVCESCRNILCLKGGLTSIADLK